MKVTLEFDIEINRQELTDALHAGEAWSALEQIRFLLRQREKHGVSDEITFDRIEKELATTYELRGY
jgi:hypothetical protein